MTRALMPLFLLFCFLIQVEASQYHPSDSLIGTWKMIAMRYQGQERPPMNPALNLVYEFGKNGSSRLKWSRDGERGFCERRAEYLYDSGRRLLKERVIWTHPGNAMECGKDLDMQVGRETLTRLIINENRIETILPLGDEELSYIWERMLLGSDR